MERFDLIIVGGGLVGASLALALRSSGLSIALIDARQPGFDDPRLLALNSSSCQFLKNLGLWQKLALHATPIHQVHVSQRGHFGAVRLHRDDVCLPSLGHVIPACFIETAMHDALQALPHFTLFQPATLQTLQSDDHGVEITIMSAQGEKKLYSPILIGADGTESTVRTQLGMTVKTVDYQQSAIVTKTLLHRSHQNIAYERFNAHGAIAMLPLTDDTCATIWTADNEKVAQLMALSEVEFLQTLQKEFGYRLGRLQGVQQRHVFPLRMVQVENAVVQGVYLLGNSAHTLHPIAAQGLNLALYEVASLAQHMMEKRANNEWLTTVDLQQIGVQTQKQQAISINLSHRLAKLFSNKSVWIAMALQLGMIGLDVATPIKKRFIENVMGRMGRMPQLLLRSNEQ